MAEVHPRCVDQCLKSKQTVNSHTSGPTMGMGGFLWYIANAIEELAVAIAIAEIFEFSTFYRQQELRAAAGAAP